MNLMVWPSGPSTPPDRPDDFDEPWPGSAAWAEALERDSLAEMVDVLIDEPPTATQVECPVCTGEGCRACAGEGWVWATNDDEAALVAFRRAAASFLHPSGFGDR